MHHKLMAYIDNGLLGERQVWDDPVSEDEQYEVMTAVYVLRRKPETGRILLEFEYER